MNYDIIAEQALNMLQTHNALAAAQAQNETLKAEVARLKQELAEVQENYHLVNQTVARLLKDRQENV